MKEDEDRGFLDGLLMKAVAGAVIVGCVGLLAFLNRDLLVDKPVADDQSLNPEFVECRDARVGQVQKMLDDGVINETNFKVFKERAIDTCAGQFPPQ